MLTIAQILPYLASPNLKHSLHQKTLDVKQALADTFGQNMPDYLIKGVDDRGKWTLPKPLEKPHHIAYKRSIYRNPFRSVPSRVIEQLDSIQQADDFTEIFPTQDKLPDELLQTYLERDFPGGLSFREWFFTRGLSLYINDPNGKIVIMPKAQPLSDRVLPEPHAFDVPCERVLACDLNFAVLLSAEKSMIRNASGKQEKDGRILWFFDGESYTVATEVERLSAGPSGQRSIFQILGMSTEFDTETETPAIYFAPPLHYCSRMPVYHIGNAKHVIEDTPEGGKLFKSVLTDAIEPLRDAQEVYVMSRIEFYQHLYSKYWQYVTSPCPLIKRDRCVDGLLTQDYSYGGVTNKKGQLCPICNGTGFVTPKSALDEINISLPKGNGPANPAQPLPSPPFAGYVEKAIDGLEKMLEEFRSLEDRAWATLNMQFMTRVPLVESGTAKMVDREPANRWLRSQSGHLVKTVMTAATDAIATQRYFVAIGRQSVEAILPKISVPKFFDIYDPTYLLDEIQALRNIKADNSMIADKQIEYERKRTGKDSPTSRLLRIKRALQPFFGYPLSDVQSLFAGGIGGTSAISQDDYILNVRFDDFIQRAVMEHGDSFWSMEEVAMKELLVGYAAEVVDQLPKPEPLYPANGGFTGPPR